MLAQQGFVEVDTAHGYHERDEPRIGGIALGDDHRSVNARVQVELRLDLAELDAMPADLDLKVDASGKLDDSVGSDAGQVAGCVHGAPCPGRSTKRSAVSSSRWR